MAQSDLFQGPLSGLNVVDFGHYYAGPMVGMMLADQGANVIRIVRPVGLRPDGTTPAQGREIPEQQFRLLNRNKKLLELDLKTEAGKAQALSLIETADVLIENFRPGVMKRLGLDYASLKANNPGLVYLSLPGFASTDTERAHIQAWEGVIGAATGLYTDTFWWHRAMNFPPIYSWVPLRSMYAGLNGAIAVMAALLAREDAGVGTRIEVPLVDTAMQTYFLELLHARSLGPQTLPDAYQHLMLPGDADEEARLTRIAEVHQLKSLMFGGYYACADGRQILIAHWNIPHLAKRLLKALGIDRQVFGAGFVNLGSWEPGLDNNITYEEQMSAERNQQLQQLVADTLKTKTAAEWEVIFQAHGAIAAVVRTRAEWLAIQPLQESGIFNRMGAGKDQLVVAGRAGEVSSQWGARMCSTHDEPEWIDQGAAEACFTDRRECAAASRQKKPLQKTRLLKGLKVLDLANFFASPFAASILAEYGAEVIKVDHPENQADSWLANIGPISNLGKKSLLLEPKTAPGRDIFQRLISWADIAIHNSTDHSAKRLGVTLDQLQAINANIINCFQTNYSSINRGGWENRVGYDTTAQAASGLMAQYGSLQVPVTHGGGKCADITTGLTLAFTALLALWQRRQTGYAGEAISSLAQGVNYCQLPFMIADAQGNSDWGEARGQLALGENWWQQLYRCKDGWIYVGASVARARQLMELVTGDQRNGEPLLEKNFAMQHCGYWYEKLNAANIGCHQVLSLADMCKPEQFRAVDNAEQEMAIDQSLDVLCWQDHPYGKPISIPAPGWVRVGGNPCLTRWAPAPRFGENTREILSRLGYTQTQINEFIKLRICHESLPGMVNSKNSYLFEPKA